MKKAPQVYQRSGVSSRGSTVNILGEKCGKLYP